MIVTNVYIAVNLKPMPRKFIKEYLSFSRKDRIAILILIFIIAAVFLLPSFIGKNQKKSSASADTTWIRAIQKLEQKQSDSADNFYKEYDNNYSGYQYDKRTGYDNKPKGELFYFDPNSLSAEGWAKLGLREKTIHTIQNYLSKGGRFRKSEDVKKIYGLFPDEYERIAPYIKIESNNAGIVSQADYTISSPATGEKTISYTPRYSIVDINNADTTALISLPGIGSKLATRIINFRDKLGGFYTVSQVGETFGLPDSTFQKIKQSLKVNPSSVKKININTASLDELKAHPYIKWSLANPIIAYRKEHGAFAKLEDLKKVMVVTDEVYNKILPYLTVY